MQTNRRGENHHPQHHANATYTASLYGLHRSPNLRGEPFSYFTGMTSFSVTTNAGEVSGSMKFFSSSLRRAPAA